MLDKVTKAVSVGTILLILLGVFNLQQRYFWFDIKVFDYMDVSEILISFSDILATIFFVLIIVGLILSVQAGAVAGNANFVNPGEVVTVMATIKSLNHKKWGCTMTVVTLVSTVLWFVFFISYCVNVKYAANWNALWFDGLYIVATITGLISIYFQNAGKTGKSEGQQLEFLWTISISLIILLAGRNYFTSSLKLSGIPKYNVELTFDDNSMLYTSPNRIYIDQSRHYIFFRELDTKKNIIISLDGVKTIRMSVLHSGL
ncbi:MAG: hypothetical protein C0490_18790 [Marivirga sp.]|nr:hypothetical protein [Marivirga sp.]